MTLTFIAVIFGFVAVMVAVLAPLRSVDSTERASTQVALDGEALDDSSGLLRFVTEGERSRADNVVRTTSHSIDEELASDLAQAS